MTVRAVILGLLAAVALASVGYANDVWMQFTCIGSDLMPTYAYGLLLMGLLLVNPLLGLMGRWRFASGEFVVMLSLVLMGSVIAGSGLMWTFPHPLITPIQDQAASPGWEKKDLLSYVPPVMMVDRVFERYAGRHGIARTERDKNWRDAVARSVPADVLKRLKAEDDRLVKGYLVGLGRRGRLLAPGEVPWANWAPALWFWFAVLGLNFIAGIAAAVVVHRQWSQREHLGYPMVIFANEMVRPPESGLFNSTFRDRRFWIGFALAFGVLSVNGYCAWNQGFVKIPLGISLEPFRELLGPVGKVPWVNILEVQFYFAAVGLAYFLTSEASFSLGISGWLYALVAAPLVAAGVDMNTGVLNGGLPAWMYFGAYVGMGLMVLYLGRRFYWQVLKRSLVPGARAPDVLPREATAARILILANVLLVLLLWRVGLHPLLGAAFALMTGLLFLIVGRINVATGLFIIQPFWHPVAVLLAVMGSFALGPQALIILALLCAVVTIDPRICVVPLVLNALKLGELQQVKPGRLAGWMGLGIILCTVAGVCATVYLLYNLGLAGTDSSDAKWSVEVARFPFRMLEQGINDLESADALQAAREPTSLARMLQFRPVPHFHLAAGIGLGLVLACSYLRLRFPRWPLHPLLFLVWGSTWTTKFAPSFLLAWLIKGAVTRYGGQQTYHRAKGFFLGLMAGEFAAGLLWGAVGVGYYLLKGVTGPRYLVRP